MLGQPAATLGGLLDELQGFQGLQSLAGNTCGGPAEVGGGDSVALAASVDLGYGAHSQGGADVDVPHEGGAPDVVPVGLVGGQLLEAAGLDEVHEFGDGQLTRPGGKTKY